MKIINIINYFFLALMTGFIALNFFWQWYPYQVVRLNEPSTMVKKTYHIGETLDWYVNATHLTTGVKVHVTREIECKLNDGVSTRKYTLPDSDFITEGKTSKFIQSSFFIPKTAFPGTHCTVNIIGNYYVNPVRTVIFKDQTTEFSIIE